VPTSVGANREGFRPCKLLPKQLATGELLTSCETCEKFRLEAEKDDQEMAEACKRLIKNCIICWNLNRAGII